MSDHERRAPDIKPLIREDLRRMGVEDEAIEELIDFASERGREMREERLATEGSTRPCCRKECSGTEHWKHDDYGSLGQGGSYEIFECDVCGYHCRSQLPD